MVLLHIFCVVLFFSFSLFNVSFCFTMYFVCYLIGVYVNKMLVDVIIRLLFCYGPLRILLYKVDLMNKDS